MAERVKIAAITAENLAALAGKKIKIEGFNGSLRGLHFNDNGESDLPAEQADLEVIQTCWPSAKITSIEEAVE